MLGTRNLYNCVLLNAARATTIKLCFIEKTLPKGSTQCRFDGKYVQNEASVVQKILLERAIKPFL